MKRKYNRLHSLQASDIQTIIYRARQQQNHKEFKMKKIKTIFPPSTQQI
jgi:hypothetical protein